MSLLPYATPDGIVYYVPISRFNKLVNIILRQSKTSMLNVELIATPNPLGGYTVAIASEPLHCMHFPNLREVDLPFIDRAKDHMLIQDRFPHLTPDEREFLISGLTPADWEALRL